MPKEIIAKNKEEWWSLVRADLAKWNASNDLDDRMGIQDWIGEVGPNIFGGLHLEIVMVIGMFPLMDPRTTKMMRTLMRMIFSSRFFSYETN